MGKLGFGMLRLPQTDSADWESTIDVEEVTRMADLYLSEGFNYFDTAYSYNDGLSEQALREAVVKRYPRDSFLIADKIPVYAMERPEELEPVFEEMLKNCGVDHFDYLLLHALSVPTYERCKKTNAFEYMQKKKDEGAAGKIGFSFHGTADALDMILDEHPETDFVQIEAEELLRSKVADIVHAQTAIACTGCRYCMSDCPMNIVISDCFSIYNTIKRFGQKTVTDVWNYYNNLIQIHGGPADCIECGMCEERCPQHLPIRKLLKTVHAELKDM